MKQKKISIIHSDNDVDFIAAVADVLSRGGRLTGGIKCLPKDEATDVFDYITFVIFD